jgi:hypothetical protein
MIEGMTLGDLAKQIKHERDSKHDFRVPTTALHFEPDVEPDNQYGHIEWKVGSKGYDATPTRHCLRQI